MIVGEPLGDLPNLVGNIRTLLNGKDKTPAKPHMTKSNAIHSPASIIFVRNRMLYARAALNAQGKVRFGLRHIRMSLNPYLRLLLTCQMFSIDFHTAIRLALVQGVKHLNQLPCT